MQPWNVEPRGRFEQHVISSRALRGNPLGDPHERPLHVYLPPAFADSGGRRYPSIYLIQGYTGQVDMWWNRNAFRPTVPERVDELFASGSAPPAIVVFVDAWTSLGGSQYVNSPGTGRYLDYLCDEVVAFVDERYPTLASRDHRGISGKSSGGYGAMVAPMLRPDIFGALASHAGDSVFEYSLLPEVAKAARALRDEYDGSYEAFWSDFRSRPAFSKEHDGALMLTYGMAACFSAEPDGTVTLPFDPASGAFRDEVWQRWLAYDPVRMAPAYADELRTLRAVYLDAGRRDDYFLDLGTSAFAAQLDALGVDRFFELFDGTHASIEYRYPKALAYLAKRLAP